MTLHWPGLTVLTVMVWIVIARFFEVDGFASGFVTGGAIFGTFGYLFGWAKCEDAAQ